MPKRMKFLVPAIIACMSLTACGSKNSELAARYEPLSLENAGSLKVNGYLWQATLDTLNFMSLVSTDAAGGVILTDWYVNPHAQTDRSKVQVVIRDSRLRSDALDVSVTRQALNDRGTWVNVSVHQATVADLEDAILIRARQLRISNVTE